MLSYEEKKAIKVLNNFNPVDCGREDTQAIETILNLIEKQSKEIEELKREKTKRSWVHIKENGEVEPLFYISEDKIKAKIDYLLKRYDSEEDFCSYDVLISILQSLLEKE